MATNQPVRVVDLFSGAGMLSAGFTSKRTSVRLALDVDADSVQSYARNLSHNAELGSATVVREDLRADLLLAGPPCQGFSTLGRRDPRDDRNALCLAIPRWARTAKPKVVVVENVPPFVRSRQWKRMTSQLEALDYEVITWILDAADYGTPQHRTRAFTLASRIGIPQQPRKVRSRSIVDEVFRGVGRRDEMHVWPTPSRLAIRRIERIPIGGDWRDVLEDAPHMCPPSWFDLGVAATDIWGRVKLGAPSNTIRCCFQNPSKGRYIHPYDDRVLSLREGARIQGVPDSWTFHGTRTSVARQIGNGVPIPLGHAVARAILPLFD
jgi:DNA (cytosine-5)-methyltransferase 1